MLNYFFRVDAGLADDVDILSDQSSSWVHTVHRNLLVDTPLVADGGDRRRFFLVVKDYGTTARFNASIHYTHAEQLLGREYYQTALGEPVLILGPIAIHACAAVAKRLLSGSPTKRPRPLLATITWTGYTVATLFLPIHYLTHRVYPTSTDPLIDAIGPAELDYEFVKYGLRHWPLRNWTLYGGLVGCMALHGLAGMKVIWQTWFGGIVAERRNNTTNSKGRQRVTPVFAVSSILAPVLIGIFTISREPTMAFSSSTMGRFEAVFKQLWLYRI